MYPKSHEVRKPSVTLFKDDALMSCVRLAGSFPNRVAAVHVLPAGTRAAVLAAAKKFEVTSVAKEAADFVTKDNEPGDVGINGVQKDANGQTALDTFRDKVIRTVVKTTSAKAKGKAS
jgi:hypothetical protein